MSWSRFHILPSTVELISSFSEKRGLWVVVMSIFTIYITLAAISYNDTQWFHIYLAHLLINLENKNPDDLHIEIVSWPCTSLRYSSCSPFYGTLQAPKIHSHLKLSVGIPYIKIIMKQKNDAEVENHLDCLPLEPCRWQNLSPWIRNYRTCANLEWNG